MLTRRTLLAGAATAMGPSATAQFSPSCCSRVVIPPISLVSATTLPNGAGGATSGKGFTNTGLVLDTTDNTWWMGNYGIATEAGIGVDTFAASIAHVSADFTTLISNITLASLGITQTTSLTGPQGVTIDTTNNTIYFACPEINNIYHVSKAGSLLATLTAPITPVSGLGVNGLTYDPVADQLVTALGSDANNDPHVITWLNKTTGATVRTITTHFNFGTGGQADGLFIDPNDPNFIWMGGGPNGSSNYVVKFHATTGAVVRSITLPTGNLASEGFYIKDRYLYMNSDAWFHSMTLNQTEVYYPI